MSGRGRESEVGGRRSEERSPSSDLRPPTSDPVDGLALGEAATARTGEDARRRGWFWHWNSIVTQYAPLLGLKGVGLLNSYTVWTDRREESPHRGYAFPSQQSEADFYGEDRAELIAINKILVALDLIEIRKEMVLRTDPQGRRWRVPHNFYRVKDHGDGFSLTGRDVLRVAELADRDKAVYRHVRRVFSPRFAPIDGDNVWHRILPELRQTELWRRLAERAAGEEGRASARTRAGHAARRAANDAPPGLVVPIRGDGTTTEKTPYDTPAVDTEGGEATSVASVNRDSVVGVDAGNDGSEPSETTSVEPVNDGGATAVDPSNTTYNESPLTTTTTRRGELEDDSGGAPGTSAAAVDKNAATLSTRRADVVTAGDAPERGAADSPTPRPGAGGPGDPPADAPAEAAAIRAFEAANDRPATPAERTLLRGIAERFAPVAAEAGRADPAVPASGWAWLAAAVYEAVEAGSAFVAPRRLREILGRWERDGFPTGVGGRRSEVGGRLASAPERRPASRRPPLVADIFTGDAGATPLPTSDLRPPTSDLAVGPDPLLPHGHGGQRTWAFTVGLLGDVLDRETLAGLVAGTAIVGYRDGEVTIAATDPAQAERLATTHRELVARKLSEAMRRPVRVAVVRGRAEGRGKVEEGRGGGASAPGASDGVGVEDGGLGAEPVASSFLVAECGLSSGRVWSAVLAELAADGEVGRANFDAWLRATALLGRTGDGGAGSALVVGVPHALARRRVAARFLPALRRAVAAVVGAPLAVEVVVGREWLASAASGVPERAEHRPGA